MSEQFISIPIMHLQEFSWFSEIWPPLVAGLFGAFFAFFLQWLSEKNKNRINKSNRILEVQALLSLQYELVDSFYNEIKNVQIHSRITHTFQVPVIKDLLVFLSAINPSVCGKISKSQTNYLNLQQYINERNNRIKEAVSAEDKDFIKIKKTVDDMLNDIKKTATDTIITNISAQEELEKAARKAVPNKWYHFNKIGFISPKDTQFLNIEHSQPSSE